MDVPCIVTFTPINTSLLEASVTVPFKVACPNAIIGTKREREKTLFREDNIRISILLLIGIDMNLLYAI
jgi:hypothetical protein